MQFFFSLCFKTNFFLSHFSFFVFSYSPPCFFCTSHPLSLSQMSFHVIYKSPCGLSLRNMVEIQRYLFQTHCDFIFLEMFCLDPYVLVDRRFQPQRPFYFIRDITCGREDIPLSCVNEIDNTPPPSVAYSKERIPEDGVYINTSLDFLVGCDCTDGCQDKSVSHSHTGSHGHCI